MIFMNTDVMSLLVVELTLLTTVIGTYIAYKGYMHMRRGKPNVSKCKHRKSSRQSLRKITVAFSIKVTKKQFLWASRLLR